MSTINKRLFDDLFVKKTVKCNQELYQDAFNLIWPCKKYFEEFLSANEFDVKLDIAKKIYKYYQTNENTFLPYSLIENLIYLQQQHLIKNGKYIPQDHIVHSLNLYILGIYVFFNFSLFQNKLIENNINEYTQNENFDIFLKKWTFFALYHDVGYVFESLVDGDGYTNYKDILEKYKTTKNDFVNQLVFRSLSNIIFDITIIGRSNSEFESSREIIRNNEKWFSIDETSITPLENNVRDNLKQWNKYVLLNSINEIKSLSSFYSIFDEDCILVIKDKNNCSNAFLNKTCCFVTESFYQNNSQIDYRRLLNIDNVIKLNDVRIKFYIKNPKSKILKNLSTVFISDIESFNDKIPENIKTEFSFINNSYNVNSTIHTINRWLSKESYYNDGVNYFDFDRYQRNYSKCLSEVLRNKVNKELEKYLIGNLLTAKSLQNELTELGNRVKKIDKEEIKKETSKLYSQTYGVSSVIFKYLDSVIKKAQDELIPNFQNNSYFELIDNSISLYPLRFEQKNTFAKALYEKITNLSKKLFIDIESLKKYHTKYSLCDHGIISASILFEVFSVLNNIVDYSKEHGDIKYCWGNIEDISEITNKKNLEIYSDSVFSIMLHNIYTKTANPDTGIEYKHNIDVNPFCYFCALLDVLQKWDRAKSIDFSILNLPNNHYLGQGYDLNVLKDEIRIICNSTNAGFMRDSVNDLDDYLPGAKKIIKVTEIEI